MKIGYARVSTEDQDTTSQRRTLKAAGCVMIFEDVASGADRERPELRKCLKRLAHGDELVVVKLDRIARSLIHLLTVMEDLDRRRVAFRSLGDPIDTTSAQGRLMLQIVGAFAEFERHLIRERTMAGLKVAKANGKKSGNPVFKAGDKAAIASMKAVLAETYLARAREASAPWIGIVRTHRPGTPWDVLCRIINARMRPAKPLLLQTMKRQVARLVAAGDLPRSVMQRAEPSSMTDSAAAGAIVAAMRREDPKISLQSICDRLESERVKPPRAAHWSKETVRALLNRQNGKEGGETPLLEATASGS